MARSKVAQGQSRSKSAGKAAKAPAESPRFTPEQAARELSAMREACTKLTEDIIEAQTNSDGGFRFEAFADSLQTVVGFKALLEDLASGLLAPNGAEVQS